MNPHGPVRKRKYRMGILVVVGYVQEKLLPAGLLLFFVLRRDWRSTLTGVLSAIVAR